jgi:glutathione synthase/RimK-type ligase-like ATP-grasp enzyme
VTDAFNPTASAVIAALDALGVPWSRFNQADFPRLQAGFDPLRPEDGVFIDEAGDRIAWGEVAAAWIWHPAPFRLDNPPGPPGEPARFAAEACAWACRSILGFLGETAFLVNPPDRSARAGDKGLQLRAARRLGFSVLETLVTNSPDEALAFCRRHGQVVFKTLNPPRVGRGGGRSWISTSLLGPRDLDALDGLRQCPGIFQPRLPKRFDLRVTLVGRRVFPVEIHSQDHGETAVDFRRCWARGIALDHRVHALPEVVRDRCLALARTLGLAYCALDLVVTPAEDYVFLEVNPSGQYGWIEHAAGLPITRALAALLAFRDPWRGDPAPSAPAHERSLR